MNYEELYSEYQVLEKEMKDRISGMQKLHKMIAKGMENRDSKSFRRGIALLESTVAGEARVLSAMKELEAGFNSWEYFGDGESVAQMLGACGELGVDVKGEFPICEMFPYRMRTNAESQDLYLDRKRVQYVHPRSFARQVKAGQDKLMKASFNALTLASGLVDVYGLVFLELKGQPEADIYLTNLYKLLAPMGRFHKDYDQQSYASDLARLYDSGIKGIKDGQRIQFDPSREGNKAIRILGNQEREECLSTIRFFR